MRYLRLHRRRSAIASSCSMSAAQICAPTISIVNAILTLCSILLFATVLHNRTTCAQRIPEHLLHCYRTPNATNATNPSTVPLPQTLQLFIELVRKIEAANPTALGMRLLSVSLLHRLRLDGIARAPGQPHTEHVTPFRANGVQAAKFQLLRELVSDSDQRLAFERWLLPAELCQLHWMLSATVDPWERGDETRLCPLSRQSPRIASLPWLTADDVQDPLRETAATNDRVRLSRCPLEGGSVRSRDYGTFAMGTVVASVVAGLQPQRVEIRKLFATTDDDEEERKEELMTDSAYGRISSSEETIDNAYAAGLAGDLAEVCLYQGPYAGDRLTVGLAGVWNSSAFPRVRYFPDASAGRWEITDAEILAGIDGLFLAQQIGGWHRKMRLLRLSQVLEMFYASRGIPVVGIKMLPGGEDPAIRPRSIRKGEHREQLQAGGNYHAKRFSTRDDLSGACDRRTILQLIELDQLKAETYRMAQVLEMRRSSVPMEGGTLRRICDSAVDLFVERAEKLVDELPTCNRVKEFARRPLVDLTLVLDGSRSEFESFELVSYIVEAIDVSDSGSWISIIHGQSGEFMVRRTRSAASVFEQLQNFTGNFPIDLSMSNALQRISLSLANQTRFDRRLALITAEPPVLLIMSQKQRIRQTDFEQSRRLLHGTLAGFADLRIAFVTNAADQIDELLAHSADASPMAAWRREQFYVLPSDDRAPDSFGPALMAHLARLPKRIMAPFCNNGSRTEYNGAERPEAGGSLDNRFVSFEDYISPYEERSYRVAPEQLPRGPSQTARFTFHVNYGALTVCMSRQLPARSLRCEALDESKSGEFVLTDPCPDAGQGECGPVHFTVTLDQSDLRCTEHRCRYPDQVLLIGRHSGLLCGPDDRFSGADRAITGWRLLATLMAVAVAVRWTD